MTHVAARWISNWSSATITGSQRREEPAHTLCRVVSGDTFAAVSAARDALSTSGRNCDTPARLVEES